MRKIGNLTVGCLNTNINAVVSTGLISRFKFVLISSIDSDTNLSTPEMGNRIAPFDSEYVFLGSGILVHGESISHMAASMNLFTGFDELWCFEHPPRMPVPEHVLMVAPFDIETAPLSPLFSSWMNESDCQLALGDGVGLNYATPNEETARILLASANYQT